jgi:hypothetical protein
MLYGVSYPRIQSPHLLEPRSGFDIVPDPAAWPSGGASPRDQGGPRAGPLLRARARYRRWMVELGLHGALAGIYALRGVDDDALDRIVRAVAAAYTGPDFGGLDVIRSSAGGEAWLLMGRWTDCHAEEVQEAAELLLALLHNAVEAGAARDGGAAVAVEAGAARDGGAAAAAGVGPRGAAVVPWVIVHGALAEGVTRPRWQGWLAEVFPRVPAWVGMHMGAPHWLGVGVTLRDGQIDQVTPYARLDLRADGTVTFTGVGEDSMLRGWIPQLRAAIEV